jgi:DNA-binding NarL/FixJ family response regulator
MKMKTTEQPSLSPRDDDLADRPIRTLLVEDSAVMMVLLARTLSKDKRTFIIGSASDGRKALSYASCLQPDLVITDLHMPGLDGAEATRLLKQRSNPPTVFVVTSDDTPEARARCMAARADAFLRKDGNLALRLLSAIQEFFPDDRDENVADPKHPCERFATVE